MYSFTSDNEAELGDDWLPINQEDRESLGIIKDYQRCIIYKKSLEPSWILETSSCRIHFINYYASEFAKILEKGLPLIKSMPDIDNIAEHEDLKKLHIEFKLERLEND
jgi:hypothetical protein